MTGLKKIIMRRDGQRIWRAVAEMVDDWNPMPGQSLLITRPAGYGAGWYRVVDVQPEYAGSTAHNEVAKLIEAIEQSDSAYRVYLSHFRVYVEERDLEQEAIASGEATAEDFGLPRT